MEQEQYTMAALVSPTAKVATGSTARNNGAISNPSFARPTLGVGSEVSFTLDNSASDTATDYFIGDAEGLIADISGAMEIATSGTISPAVFNRLSGKRIVVTAMNYEATTNAAQLTNAPVLMLGELNGGVVNVPIPTAGAKRNDQQNDKLLTLDFSKSPILLDAYAALKFRVNKNELVTITISIGAAGR